MTVKVEVLDGNMRGKIFDFKSHSDVPQYLFINGLPPDLTLGPMTFEGFNEDYIPVRTQWRYRVIKSVDSSYVTEYFAVHDEL